MNRLTRVSQYGLTALTCVALAVGPFLHIPWTIDASYHNNQRLMQVVVLIVAAIVVLVRQRRHGHALVWPSRSGALALGIWLLLGLASATQALSPRHGLVEWALMTLLLMLAMALAAEWSPPGSTSSDVAARMRRVMLACGYGCIAYIFLALAGTMVSIVGHVQPPALVLSPGYDNHRFLNHVQTISLPFLAWLALPAAGVADSPAQRAMWWRMTALWWMLLFVTGGRGTLLGIGAGVAVVMALYGRQAWAWVRVILGTGLTGLIAYGLVYVALPHAIGLKPFGVLHDVAERSLVNPSSGRLDLWRLAGEMIQAHPWLGEGPLHFAHRAMAIQNNAHPHDWLLQIAAEWGIPATLALVAALALAARGLWRRGRRSAVDDVANVSATETANAITNETANALTSETANAMTSETANALTSETANALTNAKVKHAPNGIVDDTASLNLRAVLVGGAAATFADAFVSGSIVMPMSQLWVVMLMACALAWTHGGQGRIVARRNVWVSMLMALVLAFAVMSLLRGIFPEALDLPAQERGFTPPDYPFFAPRLWRNGYF